MTEHEIDRLVSTINEMAARFGAVYVPDDVKIIIFKRARGAIVDLGQQGSQIPELDQRLKTLLGNLEATLNTTDPNAPHLMLLLQLKELAEVVAEQRLVAK